MRTKTARAIPVVLEDLGIGRLFEQTCEAAIVTADYGLALLRKELAPEVFRLSARWLDFT